MYKQKCANIEEHKMERGDRAGVLRCYPPMGALGYSRNIVWPSLCIEESDSRRVGYKVSSVTRI